MIGEMPDEIRDALLETLPVEFSVLDANDKVLAWNKHSSRIFKRPENVLGRDVRDCHPKKSLAQVEALLNEMRAGKRNKARFWIDMPGGQGEDSKKVLIEYYALRTKEEKYLGCLEVTQDITQIQKIRGEKRLLD